MEATRSIHGSRIQATPLSTCSLSTREMSTWIWKRVRFVQSLPLQQEKKRLHAYCTIGYY